MLWNVVHHELLIVHIIFNPFLISAFKRVFLVAFFLLALLLCFLFILLTILVSSIHNHLNLVKDIDAERVKCEAVTVSGRK